MRVGHTQVRSDDLPVPEDMGRPLPDAAFRSGSTPPDGKASCRPPMASEARRTTSASRRPSRGPRSPRLRPAAPLSAMLVAAVSLMCAVGPEAMAETLGVYDTAKHRVRLVKIAGGLEHPWGLAFLPDGRMLVTERPGRLRIVEDGRLDPRPVAGTPKVRDGGQGGLLDVALHPRFAGNGLVYLSYSSPGRGGAATAIARGRLLGHRLADLEEIYVGLPRSRGGRHFGSRLLFADGHLYATLGERGDPDRAQALDDPAGSIIRLRDDGGIPKDNPFAGRDGVRPEIYAYGNRNPQGMALEAGTGRIYAVEHGPLGGDELNLIGPGVNYGWPVITYGRSYIGFKIGEGTRKEGMAQPVHYWVPSISPSGLAIYDGGRFPGWRGSFLVGALSAQLLARLEIDGGRLVAEERLFADMEERIRDVRQGPDGLIYLLTDHPEGMILRIEPDP